MSQSASHNAITKAHLNFNTNIWFLEVKLVGFIGDNNCPIGEKTYLDDAGIEPGPAAWQARTL